MAKKYGPRARTVLVLLALSVALAVAGIAIMSTVSMVGGIVLVVLALVLLAFRLVKYGPITPENIDR